MNSSFVFIMWTSVRYFGLILSSVSLLSAMLEDAPNEMAEILGLPWHGWYQAGKGSNKESCLLTELGPGYAELFEKAKKNFKTFNEINRSEANIREDVLEESDMTLSDVFQEQLVARRGFGLEVHNLSVGNGWTVSVHRIISRPSVTVAAASGQENGLTHLHKESKTPVLIPSFLLGSSGFWLTAARNTSLAYILQDGGFDVWLGNYRGNSLYAHHEQTDFSKDAESPWAFTVNDHALYDTPAQIDYILSVTNQPKLHLVGMSQGSISSIQMFSLRPSYNDKVISFASLAGARTLASADKIQFIKYVVCLISRHMKPSEFLPWNENIASLVQGAEKESFDLFRDLIGMTSEYTDLKKLPLWVKYLPGGTSTWVLRYYYDLWDSNKMIANSSSETEFVRSFDYGPRGNLRRFNTESPVWMDIRNLRVPTKVYFSTGDLYSTAEENWKLVRSLPANTTEYLFIDDINYSHHNFAINDKDPSLFYDVLSFLRKAEANPT
ncbi:lipase 1-like isoform X1 [Varroa destructor]|uniref:AB hydrolase-1 domain-containing protein n=1 Tax=Varroa destructor TaxID=109461 RepID=A0A7M7KEJ8_VARDE|nr:lipase 1-like isoform X1 [Varroa destructor]